MGASYVFKQYVTELEKDMPCCPLCYREFDTEQEVRDLISEVSFLKPMRQGGTHLSLYFCSMCI